MKYMSHVERKIETAEDLEKIVAKNKAIQEERKQYPDRYPKRLLHQDGTPILYSTSLMEGIGIYEGTEDQLMNLALRWLPEAKWTFTPIFESNRLVEMWEQLKK